MVISRYHPLGLRYNLTPYIPVLPRVHKTVNPSSDPTSGFEILPHYSVIDALLLVKLMTIKELLGVYEALISEGASIRDAVSTSEAA